MAVRFGLSVLVVLLVGCAEGHCRRQVDAPQAAQPLPPATEEVAPKTTTQDYVFVFKYDGSLQCGQGKAITPETMAKELAGIPVKSMNKKGDGLMHIQVCGSTTGKANVFEIPSQFLKKAEGKGFKKWTFE